MNTTFLSPAQAADLLQISRTKMYALVRQREIKHSRVGGQIRITRQAIDDYIASHEIDNVELNAAS